jgi:DNA repair protein RecN (Recombination protein N)
LLQHLFIQNYALIDHLDIRFFPGFSAITGETGAGKSILMDALDLVLGKRADTQVLMNPDKKCIVEGTFGKIGENLKTFFENNNLDEDEQVILRREISPNGKSRAFINDTPVTLSILKSLGDMLVDIHAQHATTSLQDPAFQLSVIDSYSGNENLLLNYQKKYILLRDRKQSLQDLIQKESESRKTSDYQQFILDELKTANLSDNEQEELEDELNVITHSEEIKSSLFRVIQILSGEDNSVIDHLAQAESDLVRISGYHTGVEEIHRRFSSGMIELKEISRELSALEEGIDFNADQLGQIQQRLDTIYRLEQKHHVKSCRELNEIKASLESALHEMSSLEDQIRDLEKEVRIIEAELDLMASDLSRARKEHFAVFSNQVCDLLHHMGMPEGRFDVAQERVPEKNIYGEDKIEFYFNANLGHALKPIADIASGGELSRVMLAVKSLVSAKKMLPTIVFDEIDNGLSGDIAGRVGDILVRLSGGIQVIAITHLPQIAGKADHHYTVYKEVKDHITYSNIKKLDDKGRLNELASMIGGKDTTTAAIAAARELLSSATGITELFENN